MSWPDQELGVLFEISSSKRVLQKQWQKSGVPFYRAREIVKLSKEGAVQNELFISEDLYDQYRSKFGVPQVGDIMVSAVGTLGARYAVKPGDRFYFKDASVLRLSPKVDVCTRYIEHAFRTDEVNRQIQSGSGTTVGTLTISRAQGLRVPLPPLPEQKRIAAILDQADALREKRRAAIAKLDELLQSVFLDMFGDPVTNPKGWNSVQLINLCDSERGISYGVVQRGEHIESGVPVVRIRDINGATIDVSNLIKCSKDITSKYQRTILRGGEIVISIRGTVGRVGLVPKELVGGNITREVALIPLDTRTSPEFVLHLLKSQSILIRLADDIKGVAQSGINLRDLRQLHIIQPPAELISSFTEFARSVEWQKAVHIRFLATLNNLFFSLQQRAFRGDL